ncbi:MAG: alpha/beta fold hydrolase, partial [Candidatus Thorarchaeota archaeon]
MSVFFEELGDLDSKTLILIHGAGGSSATWFMQLRGLSDDYHVIAIDLNGHGKTLDRNDDDIFHSYLLDVDEVVSQFDSPILGGHSMGGALTQLYALKHPEKITGILLVGTGSRLRVNPMIFEMLKSNFEGYVEAAAAFMFDESTSKEVILASQNEIRKCKPT